MNNASKVAARLQWLKLGLIHEFYPLNFVSEMCAKQSKLIPFPIVIQALSKAKPKQGKDLQT
jgi:hypothetical protein